MFCNVRFHRSLIIAKLTLYNIREKGLRASEVSESFMNLEAGRVGSFPFSCSISLR